MNPEPFKICPACEHVWQTLDQFLDDPMLRFAGYQAHFADLTGGLFIFTHICDSCGTSLAIPVQQFISLSQLPILTARTAPPENCPGQCMREGCFDPCPEECECNWVREIIQVIKDWPKIAA